MVVILSVLIKRGLIVYRGMVSIRDITKGGEVSVNE